MTASDPGAGDLGTGDLGTGDLGTGDLGTGNAPQREPVATSPEDVGRAPRPPVFRVMDVMSVTLDLPGQFPILRLQEAEPPLRDLSFPVGMPEGVALAYALRRLETPRPFTHELFSKVLQAYSVDIVAVRLVGRTFGTYLAELDLMAARGREVVPCRPSDGVVLALRQAVSAPILADERLLTDDGDVTPG